MSCDFWEGFLYPNFVLYKQANASQTRIAAALHSNSLKPSIFSNKKLLTEFIPRPGTRIYSARTAWLHKNQPKGFFFIDKTVFKYLKKSQMYGRHRNWNIMRWGVRCTRRQKIGSKFWENRIRSTCWKMLRSTPWFSFIFMKQVKRVFHRRWSLLVSCILHPRGSNSRDFLRALRNSIQLAFFHSRVFLPGMRLGAHSILSTICTEAVAGGDKAAFIHSAQRTRKKEGTKNPFQAYVQAMPHPTLSITVDSAR